MLNAIAILAPAFERLAISSVLPYRGHIHDPKLNEQVQGFIGQESAHGSEFIRYNQVLKHQGYDTKKLEKDNIKKFTWLTQKLSSKMHLSLTLAAEHLTAIISDLLLKEPQWLENATPQCAALWRWHAIEEIEHKAVVYDLYEAQKGGYVMRIMGMIMVTIMLGGLLIQNFLHLIMRDKLITKRTFWGRYFSVLWGRKGFLRKLILPYLRYYVPGFHPWQHNNHDLIQHWKEVFNTLHSAEEMVGLLQNSV